jgi:hypothetical protein
MVEEEGDIPICPSPMNPHVSSRRKLVEKARGVDCESRAIEWHDLPEATPLRTRGPKVQDMLIAKAEDKLRGQKR